MSGVKNNNVTPKEHQQNNELNNKHCSKFSSKTLKLHHWSSLTDFIANFDQCSFPYLFLLTIKSIKFKEIPKTIKIFKMIITKIKSAIIIMIITIIILIIIADTIININYSYNRNL